jgi:membrane protease YdiL (CAAX protease family)
MAVIPYAMALSPGLPARLHVPLPVFLAMQFVQALMLFTLLSWAGLRLAHAIGLASSTPGRVTGLKNTIFIGCLTGFVLLVLGKLSESLMPAATAGAVPDIALWKRLLASFYGGIAEELICRLFLMSLLVWLARAVALPDSRAMWIGMIGAALLFGLGHLPAAAALFPLTATLVAWIVTLNAASGIVFGWLYWRRGLQHAMLAHFCADIVLHGMGGH